MLSLKESIIDETFANVSPWMMTSHFNTRIYVLFCLNEAWDLARQNNFEVILKKYGSFKTIIDFTVSDKYVYIPYNMFTIII